MSPRCTLARRCALAAAALSLAGAAAGGGGPRHPVAGRVLLKGKRVEGRRSVEHLSEASITQQVIAVYRSALASAGNAR